MSKLTAYTLEVYKADRRIKGGYRLVEKCDFDPVTRDYIETVAETKMNQGYIVKIFETFVTKTNLVYQVVPDYSSADYNYKIVTLTAN